MDKLPKFDPVKITCKATDCENGKHCYRPKRGKWKEEKLQRECQSCGDTTVDFGITRSLDASNPNIIFAQLEHELIRDVFRDAPVDEEGRRQIRSKGVDELRSTVRHHIQSRIGGKPNDWDGRQTPKIGSVLNLAQHATATCCRKCFYYWYGVPRDRPLAETELDFCERMVLAYLDMRDLELRTIEASSRHNPGQIK